ncbi:MAG: DUF342 domain-containing protein [Lachnospiraceae bacterium]|jgi:hypothetical protein|nr:DUF342 domain-containing protein [Lachnospiraceae bacterium]
MPTQDAESKSGIEIVILDDAMKTFASIQDMEKEYTRQDVIKYLEDMNIHTGVKNDVIDAMLKEKKGDKQYLIAEGRSPVDGKDGWFEFLFNTELDTKPKILKDGSVDYSEYGEVPSVEEGQKLVIYHPATASEDGENLFGETILAKKGKELARLKGKGFYLSEDNWIYFAKTSGRAIYENERLVVENELVIEGDVSLSRGSVTFMDDIHIRGNVLTGVTVTSERGSIVVDGYVEACELSAAKEVVLKNGMQGNGRGKIKAGGDVSGKFFEQVTVESGGSVNANAIMNSHITAVQDVIVSGRFGIIIGGEIRAERYVTATIIGNMAEVKTRIYAGVEEDLFTKLMVKEKEQEALEEALQKIVAGIEQINLLIEKTKRDDLNEKKIKLIRGKVAKENQINEAVREKQKIMDQMGRANVARISVQKTLYPGTRVSINGVATKITQEASHAEVSAKGSVIEVRGIV